MRSHNAQSRPHRCVSLTNGTKKKKEQNPSPDKPVADRPGACPGPTFKELLDDSSTTGRKKKNETKGGPLLLPLNLGSNPNPDVDEPDSSDLPRGEEPGMAEIFFAGLFPFSGSPNH